MDRSTVSDCLWFSDWRDHSSHSIGPYEETLGVLYPHEAIGRPFLQLKLARIFQNWNMQSTWDGVPFGSCWVQSSMGSSRNALEVSICGQDGKLLTYVLVRSTCRCRASTLCDAGGTWPICVYLSDVGTSFYKYSPSDGFATTTPRFVRARRGIPWTFHQKYGQWSSSPYRMESRN